MLRRPTSLTQNVFARLTISTLILHSVVSELREEPVLPPRPVSGCAGWFDVTMTLLAHIEGAQISSSPRQA